MLFFSRKKHSREDGEATLRQILGTAVRLFAEHGYTDTTSKMICREAGVNIAAVNYYFGSRDDLYRAVLEDVHEHIVNERQMELVKDTAVAHVVVEKVSFAKKTVKQYLFDRIGGLWKMTAISYKPLYENKNASFLRFYERFATDSAFQVASLANPVVYVGADPDDDFATAESEITPEMWPDFASEMPSEMIYNIIYGQTYTESDRKVFVIRGISNGLEVDMVFERRGGRWLLTKLTA